SDTADVLAHGPHGVGALAGHPIRAQHDLLHAGVADDGKCFERVVELAGDGVVDEVIQRYTEDVGEPCEQAERRVAASACSQRADVVRGDRDSLLGEGLDNAGRCVELGAVWGYRHRAEEQVESLCEVRNVFGGRVLQLRGVRHRDLHFGWRWALRVVVAYRLGVIDGTPGCESWQSVDAHPIGLVSTGCVLWMRV